MKSARRPPQSRRARSPGPQRREERPVRRPPRDKLQRRPRRERERAAAPPPRLPERTPTAAPQPCPARPGRGVPPPPARSPASFGVNFPPPKRQFFPPWPGRLCVCEAAKLVLALPGAATATAFTAAGRRGVVRARACTGRPSAAGGTPSWRGGRSQQGEPAPGLAVLAPARGAAAARLRQRISCCLWHTHYFYQS